MGRCINILGDDGRPFQKKRDYKLDINLYFWSSSQDSQTNFWGHWTQAYTFVYRPACNKISGIHYLMFSHGWEAQSGMSVRLGWSKSWESLGLKSSQTISISCISSEPGAGGWYGIVWGNWLFWRAITRRETILVKLGQKKKHGCCSYIFLTDWWQYPILSCSVPLWNGYGFT